MILLWRVSSKFRPLLYIFHNQTEIIHFASVHPAIRGYSLHKRHLGRNASCSRAIPFSVQLTSSAYLISAPYYWPQWRSYLLIFLCHVTFCHIIWQFCTENFMADFVFISDVVPLLLNEQDEGIASSFLGCIIPYLYQRATYTYTRI